MLQQWTLHSWLLQQVHQEGQTIRSGLVSALDSVAAPAEAVETVEEEPGLAQETR